MKLYKSLFFTVILFVFFSVNSIAQNISGKVINTESEKAIPFSSIAIEGTTLGTVTDFKGSFDFKIPEKYIKNKIVVSCVGFKEKRINIIDIFGNNYLQIKLEASSIDIDEVVVKQKSLFPYTIIKKAISSISNNYINIPYNYKLYYSNIDKIKENKVLKREAIVLMYDSNGYHKTSVYETFKSINYMFMYSKRNFDIKYLNDGNTNIDDLLEFDIVRHNSNILDKNRVYDFDIAIKDEINYKGSDVWVLSYSSKKPNFISTGDFSAFFYSGEIFIKKDDYAVLYNKTTVKCSNHSNISRNIYVNKKKDKKNAVYNFEVYYKQQKKYYVLDKIDYKINYDNLNQESKIKVLKLYVQKPTIVGSRDYYEDLDFDKFFWTSFKH